MQLPESGQRRGTAGKEIQPPFGIQGYLDRPVVNAIIDPVRRDLQRRCDLRYRQATRNLTRMRLTTLDQQPMPEPDRLHGAGQHRCMLG